MPSTKEYLEYVLEQLSETEEITYRTMMGEFILYCKGKVVGGIYDNRLLIKPTDSAKKFLPNGVYELPYEGAKEMLLVDLIEDKQRLKELFEAVADDLPATKRKVKKQ
ncbi:TfoX/Sxy family protein [Ruminococcus albus]|uniref:TfoX N-terminal domain-containing protein n=1 Tax=Ruminococcus albus TaxID=1264 RepID=A0A1H7FD55_RUMAL|nr:TfoX/Sxy family protein [Ruminococcus albus]SEK21175.1 TfoX N-terminal domain-containing protein [Ruminococcus albus]